MNNEFVKEWLQWVVDFIRMDISKFSLEGSLKGKHDFFKRLNWFASHSLFDTSFDPFGMMPQYSQNQILEFEISALKIQIVLKQFIDQMTTTRATYQLPDITMFIRPEGLWPPSPKNHHIYFKMNFHPKKLTPENWALVNLVKLIQGIEMHVIGKCEECQRYFLNFSLRKKSYCSPRCTSRTLARSRKERWTPKEYDAYLKKQKTLSHRWYEKKRKAQGEVVRHRPKKKGSKRIPIIS